MFSVALPSNISSGSAFVITESNLLHWIQWHLVVFKCGDDISSDWTSSQPSICSMLVSLLAEMSRKIQQEWQSVPTPVLFQPTMLSLFAALAIKARNKQNSSILINSSSKRQIFLHSLLKSKSKLVFVSFILHFFITDKQKNRKDVPHYPTLKEIKCTIKGTKD